MSSISLPIANNATPRILNGYRASRPVPGADKTPSLTAREDSLVASALLVALTLHLRAIVSSDAAVDTSTIAPFLDVLITNAQLSEVLFSRADEADKFDDTHAFLSDILGVGVWAAGRAVLLAVHALAGPFSTPVVLALAFATVHTLFIVSGTVYLTHHPQDDSPLVAALRTTNHASLPLFINLSIWLHGQDDSVGAMSLGAWSLECAALAVLAVQWHQRLGPPEADGRGDAWWRVWQRYAFLPLCFAYQSFGCGMLALLGLL